MGDCGICLEALKKPVSIPCGHVHCGGCLRSHIVSGKDAFISTCPTCRQTFHTATPELAAVPEKYQGFIQSSIRKVFIDVPSISRLTKEVSSLKGQVKTLSKEKKDLIARSERQCAAYDQAEGEWKLKMEELLFDYSELRKEHESLKFKYAFHIDGTSPASTSGSGSGNNSVNVDEESISTRSEPSPAVHSRPKRAMPKSRLSRSARHSDACDGDSRPQSVKRPRVNPHSDLDTSDELLSSPPTLTSRRTQNPTSRSTRLN